MKLPSLGAVALAFTLAGCSAGHTAVVEATDTPSVVLATTAAATSLDFTTTGGAAIPAALMGNVYETLVTIADDGSIHPGLAESWDIDGTEYTFHLREATFSNGDAFSAETAAWAINHTHEWTNALGKQLAAAHASAVDEHTLKISLDAPSESFLWKLGTTVGAMLHPSGETIGTGPYTVRAFSPGEYVDLAVNRDYWGESAHEDVQIRYFPDIVSSVNALQSGSVDIVWAVQNPELLANLPEDYEVQVGATNGEVLVSMNNQTAPFDDVTVRRAVAYGVDRELANRILFDGMATDTGGAPVAPADPWFTGKNYYPYDPEKAKELMASAGAEGTPLTITVPTLPYAHTLGELLYSQLTDIGFDVTLESAEFPALWLGQVMGAKDYQMSIVAHVEPRDITTLFGSPDYYLGYDNAHTRELFAEADVKDPELMHDAVDQIMDDAGALTVANMPNIVLSHGVTGVDANQVTDGIRLKEITQ